MYLLHVVKLLLLLFFVYLFLLDGIFSLKHSTVQTDLTHITEQIHTNHLK